MKNYYFLLIVFLLTSCTQASVASATPALEINTPTPTTQIIVTADTALIFPGVDLSGKILVYTSETVQLANSDGTSPVLIHTIESPLPMTSLSSDGAEFAYFDGNFLYVKDVLTGTLSTWNREIMGSIGGQLKWSPDGAKIALACSTSGEPTTSLCLVDKSGNIEYLVKKENIADKEISPDYFIEVQDWSRDGSKIIFLYYAPSEKGQKQDFSIYYYDTLSKTTQLVLDGNSQSIIFQIRQVNISPDNKTLLISGISEDSLFKNFVLDMDTLGIAPLQLKQLPDSSYVNPVWSSDSCCYYVGVEQDNIYQYTVVADLAGNILRTLDIQGAVLQWIK